MQEERMKLAGSYFANLRCMGTLPCLAAIFTKGNNFCDFLFALFDKETLARLGLLLKEIICSYRSKFFCVRVDSVEQ